MLFPTVQVLYQLWDVMDKINNVAEGVYPQQHYLACPVSLKSIYKFILT